MLDTRPKSGLLHKAPSPKDYVLGSVSGCPWGEVNPSGDWLSYKSEPHEMQLRNGVDLLMCTNFAGTDTVETIIYHLYGKRVNYNERALAYMSEQQVTGNYLVNVAEAIRTQGLVTDNLHPWNPKVHNTFEKMMTVYPEEATEWEEAGKKWLETYDFRWEWVYDDYGPGMSEALKCAPLFAASMYASESKKDSEGTYLTDLPNSKRTTHAVVLMKQQDDYKWVDDSFVTQTKRLAPDFRVPIGMRFWIRKKDNQPSNMFYPPKNSYVSVADTGERLLYIEGDYIIKYNTNGDAFAEAAKRNAVDGLIVPFPAIDVMSHQISHIERVTTKEWSKLKK